MTPRDWNEMKKLLGDVAKGEDLHEVLEKVSNGVEPGFRSPVKYQKVYVNDTPVTGTGKGFIYASAGNSAYKYTIIIDDVTVVSNGDIATSGDVFEFKRSFSLKAEASGKGMNCRIIFY